MIFVRFQILHHIQILTSRGKDFTANLITKHFFSNSGIFSLHACRFFTLLTDFIHQAIKSMRVGWRF